MLVSKCFSEFLLRQPWMLQCLPYQCLGTTARQVTCWIVPGIVSTVCSQLMKANNAPSRQTGAWVAYMLGILFETNVATLLVVSQHVHIRYKLNLKIKPHCRGPTLCTHAWFAIAALHEDPFTAPAYSKSRLWMLLDISSSLRPNSFARFLNSWRHWARKTAKTQQRPGMILMICRFSSKPQEDRNMSPG